MRVWLLLLAVVGVVAFWLGRQSVPDLLERLDPAPPHEAYGRRLSAAGLEEAALGRLWQRAARRALAEAPVVDAPFRETGYLDPARPEAVAYRFRARVGQQLTLEVRLDPPTDALVFLDLFRVPDGADPVRVVSADSGATGLAYEPDRDGDYLVRIQPELLRGGHYVLTAALTPTMRFPVEGGEAEDVQSFFGAPRDGGSREHHGIDIFSDRGTPAIAAVAGRVRSVRTTPVGGRVVWLRDDRDRVSVYYAHLDAQLVARGQRVEPGDTVGLIGNTGNARTTPPHLHFGIYRRGRGPIDPLPFVEPRPTAPAAQYAAEPGRWRRVSTRDARLRAAPGLDGEELARLDRQVPLRVDGVIGEWLRVAVPDGRRGFIAGRLTEPAGPLRSESVDSAAPLRDRPDAGAAEVARLAPGDRVEVLGRIGDHLYVRARDRDAWLAAEAER